MEVRDSLSSRRKSDPVGGGRERPDAGLVESTVVDSAVSRQIDDEVYQGKPGELLTINRDWKPGDRIDIDMDITTRVLRGGPSYPFSVAVQRGPQVLALDQAVNPGVADLQIAGPRSNEVRLSDAASQLPAAWLGKQAYVMDGLVAGKPHPLVLVPFADARSYRVWMAKPQ